ncbi:MAG: transposase [Anaerolineae bacterium]
MSKKRRQFSAEYKFKIALEAAKGTKTLAELASETGVHPKHLISQWKSQLLAQGASIFQRGAGSGQRETDKREVDAQHQVSSPPIEAAALGNVREQVTVGVPLVDQVRLHVPAAALADDRHCDQLAIAALGLWPRPRTEMLDWLPEVIDQHVHLGAEVVKVCYHCCTLQGGAE